MSVTNTINGHHSKHYTHKQNVVLPGHIFSLVSFLPPIESQLIVQALKLYQYDNYPWMGLLKSTIQTTTEQPLVQNAKRREGFVTANEFTYFLETMLLTSYDSSIDLLNIVLLHHGWQWILCRKNIAVHTDCVGLDLNICSMYDL